MQQANAAGVERGSGGRLLAELAASMMAA